MSVLGSDHSAESEKCFVVIVTEQHVQAWLLTFQAGSMQVAGASSAVSYSDLSELTVVTDTAIQDLGPDAEQVEQVVFCFSPDFIVSDTLSSDKSDTLSSLVSQLRLKPIGFVSLVEAVGYYLIQADHQYRGVGAAVFAEHLELQLIENGQVVSHVSQAVQDTIEETTQMALQQLVSSVTSLEAIHCSIAIFGGTWSAGQWQSALEGFAWSDAGVPGEHHCQVLTESDSLELGVTYASKVWLAALASEDPVLRASAETFGATVGLQLAGELDQSLEPSLGSESGSGSPRRSLFHSKSSSTRKGRRKLIIMSMLGVVLGLLCVGLLFIMYLKTQSQLQLRFSPQTQTIANSAYFTLSSTLSEPDLEKSILPAAELTTQVAQSESGPTTGTGFVGEKATGTVQILNKIESEKTLPAGTEFTSGAGVVFVLPDQVTLPPASISTQSGGTSEVKTYGTAESRVEAKEIGESGNIASLTTLSVGEYAESTYSALAKDSFSGGSKQEVSIVTEQDIKHLTEVAKQAMTKQAEAEFAQKANENQVVSPSISLSAVSVNSSAKVGEQADSLTVDAAATATALVFDKQVLKDIATSLLVSDVPAGYALLEDSVQLLSDYDEAASGSGRILVDVTALAQQEIQPEQVSNAIKGQSFSELDAALQRAGLVGKTSWVLEPAAAQIFVQSVPSGSRTVVVVAPQL